MATVAQLNVRIGGDIRALEKSLKDAERAVRNAGNNLSAIGNQLSAKLTLPLLGFGVAALKVAGDMEALNKSMVATFQGAGRSSSEAADEINALQKAAEAPGLDFEQAIKASIRLQGVGLQAEAARRTIVQLANAIATTGGAADNLNSVTVQFSQMISKGKIMASDLRIVQENMPVISRLMEETFGTSNSERLQEMGISGKEFVEKITAAMAKLPRVEGGISNAIVNAGVAIKVFLASVGESLNKTFNITEKLNAFSSWLGGLAARFGNLSEGAQKTIAAIGVFAITLGPMVKVGQFAILVYGQMVAVFAMLKKALLQSLAGEAIPGAIAAFKALNLATRLTIIGAAIGVILALAAAFSVLKTDMSDAAVVARTVDEVNKSAAASIVDQKSKVDLLVGAFQSEKATLEGKKNILAELNQISPEYFGQIKVGKGDVDAITLAQGRYNAELLKTAKITAAKERIVELSKALLDAEKLSDVSVWQTAGNALLSFGNASAFAGNQTRTAGNNFVNNTKTIQAQIDALAGLVTEQEVSAANMGKTTAATEKSTETKKEHTERIKAEKQALKDLNAEMDFYHKNLLAIQRQEIEDIKSQNKPFDPLQLPAFQKTKEGENTNPVKSDDAAKEFEERMKRASGKVKEAIQSVQDGTATTFQKIVDWADKVQEKIGGWATAAQDALGALSGLSDAITARNIDNLNKEMAHRLKGVKEGSAQEAKIKEEFQNKIHAMERRAAIRAKVLAIAEATILAAQGVLKGLAKGSIPGAVLAGALGAVQIAKIIATPLAEGGIISGPTHALVGEYPGARNNPEVVAPLNKLKTMLRDSGGGQVQVGGTFRIHGTDMLLVLEKAQKSRGRAAGY